MSAPIKVYYSGQAAASAPTLTGQAGSLTTLLYAVLVTGYGTKTIDNISVTNNVATVTTTTAHRIRCW